jgi:hypothetical protein
VRRAWRLGRLYALRHRPATRELDAAGSIASLPAGTETTWHISAPFREFWVIGGTQPEAEA